MELIEGISDEVILAFMVTLLLGLATIFYVFTNGTAHRSRENNSAETNVNVNTTSQRTSGDNRIRENSAERQGVYTARTNYESADASSSENLRADTPDREENEPQRTIAIRVKHNENVQSFNISRNCTVLELKRYCLLKYSNWQFSCIF